MKIKLIKKKNYLLSRIYLIAPEYTDRRALIFGRIVLIFFIPSHLYIDFKSVCYRLAAKDILNENSKIRSRVDYPDNI